MQTGRFRLKARASLEPLYRRGGAGRNRRSGLLGRGVGGAGLLVAGAQAEGGGPDGKDKELLHKGY